MEALKLLLPKTSDLSKVRIGGKPEITAEDVCAALARLPVEASLYGRYLVLDDEIARELLIRMLVDVCLDMGFEGDITRLRQLVNLGLSESHGRNKCPQCKGVGKIGIHKCEHCNASGLKRPTEASRAKALGIARGKFKKTWQHRYEQIILPVVTYLEMEFSEIRKYLR